MRSVGPVLVAVLCTVGVACGGAADADAELRLWNESDTTITLRYEVGEVGDGALGESQTIASVGPGDTYSFTPSPAEGDCTVAPLVAIGPTGDQLDRLDAGTCFDPPITIPFGHSDRPCFDVC